MGNTHAKKTYNHLTFETTFNLFQLVYRQHKSKHSKQFEEHITYAFNRRDYRKKKQCSCQLTYPTVCNTNNGAESKTLINFNFEILCCQLILYQVNFLKVGKLGEGVLE